MTTCSRHRCRPGLGAAAVLLLLALGCPTDEAPGVWAIQTEVNEAVPTVVTVTWTSAEAGVSHVEYGLDGLDRSSPTTSAAATEHAVRLLGLKAGATYRFRVVTEPDGGDPLVSDERELTLAPPPAQLPDLTVSEVDAARMQPGGYVLTSYLQPDNSWVVILDRDGDYVWFHEAAAGLSIPTAKPGRDGQSILYTQNDREQTADLSGTVRVSLDGEIQTVTRILLGHHDFVELPDGTIAWISLETRELTVEKSDFLVAGDVILEAEEGFDDEDGKPPMIFNFFDDYGDPWITCNHFFDEAYGTGAKDWTHCNSLMYDEADDAYLIMCRNLDNLLKISRSNGEIIWEIGGLHATVELPADDAWSHGHMSHFWGDGFLVFDNGYHHDPQHSRVAAYDLDTGAGSAALAWDYWDPEERFIPLLGDARRLPGGNTLACWTSAGLMTELTPDGDVVWRLDTDIGTAMGRVTWIEDLYQLR